MVPTATTTFTLTTLSFSITTQARNNGEMVELLSTAITEEKS